MKRKTWSICKECGEFKEAGKQCQECQTMKKRDQERAEELEATDWEKVKKEAEE